MKKLIVLAGFVMLICAFSACHDSRVISMDGNEIVFDGQGEEFNVDDRFVIISRGYKNIGDPHPDRQIMTFDDQEAARGIITGTKNGHFVGHLDRVIPQKQANKTYLIQKVKPAQQ